MQCTDCGKLLPEDITACPHCATPPIAPTPGTTQIKGEVSIGFLSGGAAGGVIIQTANFYNGATLPGHAPRTPAPSAPDVLSPAPSVQRVDGEIGPTSSLKAMRHTANPFIWRGGITEADAFFDREREQRRLRDSLHKRQNCQVVGERRIGKTSLLLQIARTVPQQMPDALFAVVDMTHPTCFTLNGFLHRVGHAFGCTPLPDSLTAFAEHIETLCRNGKRPVLCVDEFEECTQRRDEFSRDFFLTLRSCSQGGMAVITASRQPLNRLTDPHDPTSPFYNTFQLLSLSVFSEQDAADFLTISRPGIPTFSPTEKTCIMEFARCHPLALQVACCYVVEAKENNETISPALQRAKEEMRALLPSW